MEHYSCLYSALAEKASSVDEITERLMHLACDCFEEKLHQFLVFGLTGTEISITSLGFETLGLCLATVFLVLAVRIVAFCCRLSLEGKIIYCTSMGPESNCPNCTTNPKPAPESGSFPGMKNPYIGMAKFPHL